MTGRIKSRLTTLFLLLLVALWLGSTYGQVSPGDLHKTHSFLEGIQNCQKCHDPNQGASSEKCFACHSEIKASIERRMGMHGKQEYTQCQTCHIEHQGRDYELVYWDKGMKSFDHSLTGYRLEGKHLTLECRSCHLAKNIPAQQTLLEKKKDLARTFFGLDEKCVSCHTDEHRGMLAATCTDCHTMDRWKPAVKFNHGRAKFVLVGKHMGVPCEKCHKLISNELLPNEKSYTKFTGIKYGECLDCHRDAHEGKLGTACEKCHDANSWGVANRAQFDHNRTRFPLLGKHSQVLCDKCHKTGKSIKGLKFGKCQDCHDDSHRGEFADRVSQGACEECHTVNGYVPANFTVAQHLLTEYPLKGAHLAIACNLCHGKSTATALKTKKQYTFASTRCQVCHKDVHQGSLDKLIASDGCELCHRVESWRELYFDHARTKFVLEGKHASVPCRPCHGGKDKPVPVAQLRFAGVTKLCDQCHKDNHRGQFASVVSRSKTENAPSICERCHTAKDWKTLSFDHNRDSLYPLEGAHRKVACSGCHKQVVEDGVTFARYKPLDTKCKSCHGETELQELRRD